MTRPRLRALGQFAAVALVALSACSSSSPPNGSDGSGNGGNGDSAGPAVDGSPPPGLFPLHVSSDHASLVTDDGKPFLLHGEAAWSLIVQLDEAEVTQYLADRQRRGVTAVLVNLIEHKFADRPPLNAAGQAPFSTTSINGVTVTDFTKPNEKYFAYADRVIDLIASQGMAILLTPAYLGYMGGDQGWFADMAAQADASIARCTTYGTFLGQRYASRHNIIWVWGGDFTPPSGSGESCMLAIRDAIRAAQPTALTSGHWAPESTSLDEPNFAAGVDIVGVYTYEPVSAKCRDARPKTPRKPTYLFETRYENEPSPDSLPTGDPFHVRRQQWWGMLGCGAGEISGNDKIWQMVDGWPSMLSSPVSIAQQRLAAIVQSTAWQTLTVDDALITSGRGSSGDWTEVVAARTSDQKQALIYIPEGGATSITVDLNRMAGPVTALWQDPTVDHSVAAGDGITGSHVFTTPGLNSGQNHDWVLVLTAP